MCAAKKKAWDLIPMGVGFEFIGYWKSNYIIINKTWKSDTIWTLKTVSFLDLSYPEPNGLSV